MHLFSFPIASTAPPPPPPGETLRLRHEFLAFSSCLLNCRPGWPGLEYSSAHLQFGDLFSYFSEVLTRLLRIAPLLYIF